ncbi:MAG: RNA-binding domain-containing protein [Promethearchaeota archaeon]
MEYGGEIIQIIIKTPIHQTEDREKIRQCFEKIFGKPSMEEKDLFLIIRSNKMNILSFIREKLKQQRIRDSVRKILLKNMNIDSVSFYLNKQAAFMGRIHFVTNPDHEDYLGPITIIIKADEDKIKEIINWLTMVDFEVN